MKSVAVVASVALPLIAWGDASAQIEPKPYPSVRTTDGANVDILTGLPFWSIQDVTIGGHSSFGLSHSFSSRQASFSNPKDSFEGGVLQSEANQCPAGTLGPAYPVLAGEGAQCFYLSNGVFTTNEGRGGFLEFDGTTTYTYTTRDGTRVLMSTAFATSVYRARVYRMERPDGLVTLVHYTGDGRINGVSNNAGFRLQYIYSGYEVIGVAAYNAAYFACDPTASCVVPAGWPTSQVIQTRGANFSTKFVSATGEETVFSGGNDPFPNYARFETVKLPANATPSISYEYCPHAPNCTILAGVPPDTSTSYTIQQFTVSASVDGATWTYGMNNAGTNQITRNSTSPTGLTMQALQRTEGWNVWLQIPGTRYDYSSGYENHIASVTRGQGDVIGYGYDARGNVTAATHSPAPGFSDPVLSASAVYPTTCVNRVTCNKPTSVTDARSNTTTYTYDPDHGGVLTSIGPTDASGTPRSTRFTYVERYARYLGPTGAVVQAPDPIWLLESERTCRTSAPTPTGCAAANDEVVTLYDYGPTTGVNNLLLRGVVHDATGAAARTCYGYDRLGNRISQTAPAAQLGACP